MADDASPAVDTYALFQEGRRRLRSGHAAQATVPLERARRAEPRKASIREALGIAYFRLARWHDAEEEFRAVLDVAPTDAYAHRALARCLDRQGRRGEATGHYKLAQLLEPGRAGGVARDGSGEAADSGLGAGQGAEPA